MGHAVLIFTACTLSVLLAGCQSPSSTQQPPQPPSQSSTGSSAPSSPSSAQQQGVENQAQGQNSADSATSTSAASPTGTRDDRAAQTNTGQSGSDGAPPAHQGEAGQPAVTGEEAVGVLDEQLDASLGVFDGMILTERAAAREAAAGGDGGEGSEGPGGENGGYGNEAFDGPLFEEADLTSPGGVAGTDTGNDTGDPGTEQTGTVPPMPSGSENGTTSSTVAGAATSGGHGNVPPDLVDGSDDDIVARQIREAAIKETDPALREKLWEEYRKYKKGS